jgi:hemoglobin
MSTSLYDRLGGEPSVNAAVDIFYVKVLGDTLLAPFFDGVDMEKQKTHQRAFLTVAFGGPSRYSGRGMAAAHRRLVEDMGLTDKHFDAVVGHLGATLVELGVPGEMVQEAAAIAESVRDAVLGRA